MFKMVLVLSLLHLSIKMIRVSHPLILAFLLMLSCGAASLMLLKFSFSWLFFLLCLMFLGGVMVIVAYMASLAANEKIFLAGNKKGPALGFFVLFLLSFYLDDVFLGKIKSSFLFAGGLFDDNLMSALSFCFLMLLCVLISVTKLVKLEEGPLVKRL